MRKATAEHSIMDEKMRFSTAIDLAEDNMEDLVACASTSSSLFELSR